MKTEHMIAIIYCGTQELLRKVPVEKVKQFETEFLEFMDLKYKDELKSLKSGILTGEIEKVLRKAAAVVAEKFGSA